MKKANFERKSMKYPVLKNSPIFKGVREDELDDLLHRSNYKIRSYHEGTVVALADDEIASLMIVISGEVRGEMVDMTGKRIKIEDIRPPMALAAAFIFGPGSRYPVNVVANVDSEMLVISKGDFMRLMQSNATVLSNYLSVVCSKAMFLSGRLRFLSFRTIKGKLAHYILNLPLKEENRVTLDKTQEQLADYFGVTRPSLARALASLEEAGLINAKNRNIKIIDWEALIRLTHD